MFKKHLFGRIRDCLGRRFLKNLLDIHEAEVILLLLTAMHNDGGYDFQLL